MGLESLEDTLLLQGLTDGQVEAAVPLLDVDEAALKANELREGSTVALDPSIMCMVSFAPGQERRVVLGLHGLEQVRHATNI